MADLIKVMSLDFQYVPERGVSGWVKQEVVEARTFVDGQSDREMLYHRFSFDPAVSGTFDDVLYEQPFGLASVSG